MIFTRSILNISLKQKSSLSIALTALRRDLHWVYQALMVCSSKIKHLGWNDTLPDHETASLCLQQGSV